MKRVFSSSFFFTVVGIVVLMLLTVWYRNTTPRREAQEIWLEHERVISEVAAGKRVNLDDFESAAHFFEKLTKISVPSDHSTFIDRMPTRETATSLIPLRRWYAENGNRLYWDEGRHEVKLDPK